MRIRVCEAAAAEITQIEASKQNITPGGMPRMDQNFAKSMPQRQANCISAALPGAHALGRVHSPTRRNDYHMARRDGGLLGRRAILFLAQR